MFKICGCNKVIPLEMSACDACLKKRDDNKKATQKHYDKNIRDKRSAAFYNSKEWKAKRVEILNKNNYICVHCLKNKTLNTATCVDHITPLKIRWDLRLANKNLQPLCDKCHRVKTEQDKIKYR